MIHINSLVLNSFEIVRTCTICLSNILFAVVTLSINFHKTIILFNNQLVINIPILNIICILCTL